MDITIDNQQKTKSYIGGLYDAEGWKCFNKKGILDEIGFVNTNLEIVNNFDNFLKSIECSRSITKRKRKAWYRTQYQFSIHGRYQAEKFKNNTYSIKLETNPTDISWLFGMLDGDGMVGISKLSFKSIKYRPHIEFFNTDVKIIEKIKFFLNQYNIPFYIRGDNKNRNKTKYIILISGAKRCKKFIDTLIEFAEVKKKRLEILNTFINSRLSRPHQSPYSDEEILCYERLKLLNDFTSESEII
jgi:hypothetical protein